MYSVIIFIVLGVVLWILAAIASEKNWEGFSTFLVVCGTLSFALLSWLFPLIFGFIHTNTETYTKDEITPIVSLRDDSLINGSVFGAIFIVSGNIQQVPVYFYYTQNSDGGYEQHNIPTANVALYEDSDSGTGYLKVIKYYSRLTDYQPYKGWGILNSPSPDYPEKTVEQIHIPQGTIVKQFKVN
jgi:hypothetical protein